MSYRRKRLCILFGVIMLSSASAAGCAGTAVNALNESQSETEHTAEVEETESVQILDGQFSYEEMFTERDLSGEYDDTQAVPVTLSDDEIRADAEGVTVENHTVTITEAGTYVFSGTLSEGQIVVDAEDAKVQIVLDGVDITCAASAAIYVKSADKVFVTLEDGSENVLRNTEAYVAIDDNKIDAVIFSKADLTLNGNGSLTVTAENGHGIVSKDNLKITGGMYDITAESHALSGKDSVRIAGGTFELTSGKDGIHAENEENVEKGYVYIADGNFTIVSDGDGVDASGMVQIEDGTFTITAGGGAANSTDIHVSDKPGGSMPQMGDRPDRDNMDGENDSGNSMPQRGDRPDRDKADTEDVSGNSMPQMGERPDGEAPQEGMDGTIPQQDAGNEDNSSTAGDEATANVASTKGIKSDGNIYLNGGIYKVDSADDSVHSNASVTIADGTYTIAAGDDGVHADDALVVDGGTITITESYEGLEGLTVTINGGTIDITSSDDGINAAGGTDASGFGPFGKDTFKGMDAKSSNTEENEMWMEINGGTIHVLAGGDGLDSNGDLTVNGGELYIDGPSDNGNSAIDYGDHAAAYINGGTVVAVGSSGMAEKMSDSSKQEVLMVKLGEQKQAGEVILTDSDGNVIVSYTTCKAYDCVIISTADLERGATYTLTASGMVTEVTAGEE